MGCLVSSGAGGNPAYGMEHKMWLFESVLAMVFWCAILNQRYLGAIVAGTEYSST